MSSARAGSPIAWFSASSSWWQRAGAAAAGNRLVEDRASGHLLDVLLEVADGELLRDRDVPLVGRFLADDHAEEGGLAGPVGSDQTDFLARVELEGGVDEEDLPSVLLADLSKETIEDCRLQIEDSRMKGLAIVDLPIGESRQSTIFTPHS
jgi:hypothetical protein